MGFKPTLSAILQTAIPVAAAVLLTGSAIAQPVLKEYKGRYINGKTYPAEAEYTFYQGDKGEEIRHGNFRYQVRETEGNDKYSQAFRGKYVDGLKSDQWSYRISMREYNEGDSPLYLTGTINLFANYKSGLPQGRWEYNYSMKHRSEVVENGVKKWGRYSPTRKINIILNFKDGMMVDSLVLTDTHGTSIFGMFDQNGFFHQDWIILTDSTEEIFAYDHGVLLRRSFRKLSSERFDLEDDFLPDKKKLEQLRAAQAKGPAAIKSLPFSADTSSIFSLPSHIVRSLVVDKVYNDDDFLYRYIPGDRNFVFDESRKQFRIEMKGGYTVDFRVKLSPEEETRFLRIRSLKNEISDINSRTEAFTRGKTMPANLRNAANLISHNATLADGYLCLAQKIAQSEAVKDGVAGAVNCRQFQVTSTTVAQAATKTAAFDAIIKELKAMKDSSQKYYDQIRQNR